MNERLHIYEIHEQLIAKGLAKDIQAIDFANRILGLWGADILGVPDRQAYAAELAEIDRNAAGRNDMLFKLHSDLEAKGFYYSDRELQDKALHFLFEVAEKLLSETGEPDAEFVMNFKESA